MSGFLRTLTTMTAPGRHYGPIGRADPARQARLQRDDAVERVWSITKGVAVGSTAAVAGLVLYLSQALPGHSTTPSSTTGAAGTGAVPAPSGTGASSPVGASGQSAGGVASPSFTPAPSQQQVPVVSGSS